MIRNTTIRAKKGLCPLCSDGKEKELTKGLCSNYHYWQNIKMKSVAKQEEKEVVKEKDLWDLIETLDLVYSHYIRLKSADEDGRCKCVTCGYEDDWKVLQCGHFIPRQHFYTRYLEINTHPQCKVCNEYKKGNMVIYANYLNSIKPGIVESLQEQANIIYKFSRDEIKSMTIEYRQKIKQLKLINP